MKKRTFVFGLIGTIFLVVASGVFWASNLPSIEITGDEVRVVNCEQPVPKYARGVCPKLYCKKAAIESGLFPAQAEIGFHKSDDKAAEKVVGAARFQSQDATTVVKPFQCIMEDYKVVQLTELE